MNSYIADLILISLASGRIAYSVASEDIFAWLRVWAVNRSVTRRGNVSGFIAPVLTCWMCLSFWSSLGLLAGRGLFRDWFMAVVTVFAVWAVATLVAKAVDR